MRSLCRPDKWDVTQPAAAGLDADLVLHAAAWTDVDGAEDSPEGAFAVNAAGTRNVVALGAPVVYYSSDYVFDGSKGAPYVESDEPGAAVGLRGVEAGRRARGRSRLDRAQLVAVRLDGAQLRADDAPPRSGAGRGSVVDDQRGSPTYTGHLAAGTRELLELPEGDLASRGRRATARGRNSRRRSSRRRASIAASGGSRPAELGRPAPRPGVLGVAQRAGRRAAASALARGPARVPAEARVASTGR